MTEKDTAELKIHRMAKDSMGKALESCCDFDKLIEFVYPLDYNVNKKLYNEYRNWLFMFPV